MKALIKRSDTLPLHVVQDHVVQRLQQAEEALAYAVGIDTDSRCHICGGRILARWQADHVMAHSSGGRHAVENYLPAHKLCNNYRWDYSPEEFQWILKLGVWARTQIERDTHIGAIVRDTFYEYERRRDQRRRRT